MAFSKIPAFPIHSPTVNVRQGLKSLSRHVFAVIVFAASGISARSQSFAWSGLTVVVEWSEKGKKTIFVENFIE